MCSQSVRKEIPSRTRRNTRLEYAWAAGTPSHKTSRGPGRHQPRPPRPGPGPCRRLVRRHPCGAQLNRLARSVPDARHIGETPGRPRHRASLGGTIYDPADLLGKMFFNILATFAEFEVDLLRLRTREGMPSPGAKGRRRRKQPSWQSASKPSSSGCTGPVSTPSPT